MALGWVWWRACALVARGAAALCLAGVALGDIHLHFAWQAWHVATSTCVARVALGDLDLRLARQAWRLVTSTLQDAASESISLSNTTLSRTNTHTTLSRTFFHISLSLSHATLSHTTLPRTHTHAELFRTQLFHKHISLTQLCHP